MMLYKNTKLNVHSPDGNTDFFDIVAGLLQGDTLAPYLFIICLDYVLRLLVNLMKENCLTLEMAKRWYPERIITDADYADVIALLAHTAALAKSLLHSLERAAGSTGLHVNADKTYYMCFNQSGDISKRNCYSLKLVDKFPNPRSSVSSTKNYIYEYLRLAKVWTAIDRLSFIWKLDLSDKIKSNTHTHTHTHTYIYIYICIYKKCLSKEGIKKYFFK